MAAARQRDQRTLIVALAALTWSNRSAAELEEFIRCGALGSDSQVMPYSPAVLEAIANR